MVMDTLFQAHLYRPEMDRAAEDERVRYQSVVPDRRAEREAWMRVLPPPMIGAAEIVMDTLQGACPGTYTGPARVISQEDEFDRVQPGDVLVCPTTSTSWNILFGKIGAWVTDSGGILSHPAIIAREFGIPTVVATGKGTKMVKNGQRVQVDGTAGVVYLLDSEGS
jgi:phosphohistidine swiveling domain-containing protein